MEQLRAHLRSTRRTHAALDLEAPDLSECAKGNVDLCSLVRPYLEKVLGFFVLDQVCGAQPLIFHISSVCQCKHASARSRVSDSPSPPPRHARPKTICALSGGALPRTQTEQEWISQTSVLVQVISEACQVAPGASPLQMSAPAPVCASLASAWTPPGRLQQGDGGQGFGLGSIGSCLSPRASV